MLGIAGIYRYLGRILSCLVMLSLSESAQALVRAINNWICLGVAVRLCLL